jgi:release factor glutamine methyltransferase
LVEKSYVYSEDSKLLGRVLSSVEGCGSYLEIGAGGAGNLLLISGRNLFATVVGTYLSNLWSARKELPENVELVKTDRATCFRENTFDLVAFNPPYVPSLMVQDPTTDGGPGGMKVPLEFLASGLDVLKANGRIVMLLSSEDSLSELEIFCNNHGLFATKIAEEKLFFESLFVYSISKQKIH